MIRIETVIEDEDSLVQGGAHFYWEKGSSVVLIQKWEHKASGPIWFQVEPDKMFGTEFVDYLLQCWEGYRVVDVVEDFS